MVGYCTSSIEGGCYFQNLFSSGNISGEKGYSSSLVSGGIVGSLENGEIFNSSSTVGVFGITKSGGLVGSAKNLNIISSSFAGNSFLQVASDTSETSIGAGGLLGVGENINIASSSFSGTTKSMNGVVGGLVGVLNNIDSPTEDFTNSISNSYSVGRVETRNLDFSCDGGPSDPGLEIGGLVGIASSTEIYRSYFSNNNVIGQGNNIGGLVGYLDGSTIYNSYIRDSQVSMSSDCTSENVGGLVGFSNNSQILNTYATSTSVGALGNVGGLVGYLNSSSLNNSLVMANSITGETSGGYYNNDIGGLVGSSSDSSIYNSYYKMPSVYNRVNDLGEVKTVSDLGREDTFVGWNFSDTWLMLDIPLLRFSFDLDGKINTCQELQLMSANLSGDYILENDIDCSGYSGFKPIGSPEKEFSGTLNGAGYSITGLSISKPDSDNVGLFAYLTGEVSNINFVDISIIGKNKVGVVAGESSPSSSLNNIHVNNENAGEISSIGIDDSGYWFGGLVGYFSGSIASSSFVGGEITASNYVGGLVGSMIGDEDNISSIEKSFSNTALSSESEVTQYFGGLAGYVIYSDISESYAGDLSGNVSPISVSSYAGGLIGKTKRTNISNTYSNIFVNSYMEEGGSYLGGLVGSLEDLSTITNSYSIGVLSTSGATSTIGGLVGYASNDSMVNDSFYDLTLSGMSDTGKGVATTSSQLKKDSTFSDWDLLNIWERVSGNYPTLRSIVADDLEAIPEEVYVNSTWSSESELDEGLVWEQNAFSDISAAISAVAEGGTVYLLNSSDENSDFIISSPLTVEKSVNIVGEDLGDEEKVVIEFVSFGDNHSSSRIDVSTTGFSFENLKIIDNSLNHNIRSTFSVNASSDISFINNELILTAIEDGAKFLSAINIYSDDNYISDINIINNKISQYVENNAIDISAENGLNNINISGNEISDNRRAINFWSSVCSDVSISDNEMIDNDTGLDTAIECLEAINFKNNKIYGDPSCEEGEDCNMWLNVAVYAYPYFEETKEKKVNLDLKNNLWGSEDGPNVYLISYEGEEWRENDTLVFGLGDYNISSIIIDLDYQDFNDSYLKNINILFRPFYKNSGLTESSNKKIIISEENGLSELFTDEYFGTMNISPEDIDKASSTKASKVKVAEKLDIEIPAASGVASTTISLPANTEITKSDTEEDKYFTYQDLSAAELATNALSGFQSGELIGALQWGIPSVGLSFSSPVTIEMYVGTELAGQVLELYRSISTSGGWTKDGLEGIDDATTDGTCLVNETGMCKFKTTKASYFGVLKASSSGDGGDGGSSNSSAPITLPSGIGSGARDISGTSIGSALHAGEIDGRGVNFLTYVTNQNNFTSQDSSNKGGKTNHYFTINSLDLNTETANITFFSNPKTISIKKGETKELDLDGDKVNDISVTFSNVYVNRAEITVKQLSNVATVSPEANTESTVEIIKITNDSMYNKLKGKIILKVGDNGRAYYISPIKKEMYYLGRPTDAFSVMRSQGIGITNANLDKILVNKGKASSKIDSKFTKAHLGKIFIQTELNGEAWYVNPEDSSRHFLGRPSDAFQVMRKLGLGISNADFEKLIK